MTLVQKLFSSDNGLKTRKVAIALAISGVILPGLHKFYLRQWGWGVLYVLLWPTHISQVASIIEGIWYGVLNSDEFDYNFNPAIAHAQPHQPLSEATKSNESSLHDPTHRFQSFQEVRLAASLGVTIDVNQATEQDWSRLPSISAEQGRSLTALQKSGVQFHCLDDLAAALGMSQRHLKPLEPILRFCYYDRDDLTPPQTINPNEASIATLTRITGVDVPLALQIVHHRTPPYRDLADFQQRLSLSASQVEQLMHYLCFPSCGQ